MNQQPLLLLNDIDNGYQCEHMQWKQPDPITNNNIITISNKWPISLHQRKQIVSTQGPVSALLTIIYMLEFLKNSNLNSKFNPEWPEIGGLPIYHKL